MNPLLPMNSLLASNQNKFSQEWKCAVWKEGGQITPDSSVSMLRYSARDFPAK